MKHEDYLARLRPLACRLAVCLSARPASYWRKNQRRSRIVELGTAAIYAIEQSSYWGENPTATNFRDDSQYHPYFQSVLAELTTVGKREIQGPSLWRAGYYFNDAGVRIRSMAEQLSRLLYEDENALTKMHPLLQRIRKERDYFAHQHPRKRREVELEVLLSGLDLLVSESEKFLGEANMKR